MLVFAGLDRITKEAINECWISNTTQVEKGWRRIKCKNIKEAAQGPGYEVTCQGLDLIFKNSIKSNETRVLDLKNLTWRKQIESHQEEDKSLPRTANTKQNTTKNNQISNNLNLYK